MSKNLEAILQRKITEAMKATSDIPAFEELDPERDSRLIRELVLDHQADKFELAVEKARLLLAVVGPDDAFVKEIKMRLPLIKTRLSAERQALKDLKAFEREPQTEIIHIRAQAVVDGVPVNPVLPKNFDDTRNEDRPESHQKWWNLPFIQTETREEGWWHEHWPSGTRYDVRCLDGGAWDRSTFWGGFATMEAAVRCAQTGPSWRRRVTS